MCWTQVILLQTTNKLDPYLCELMSTWHLYEERKQKTGKLKLSNQTIINSLYKRILELKI